MQTALKPASLSPVPVEELAHSRRTAAVAELIAFELFLTSEEKTLLCAACLLHHWRVGPLAQEGDEPLLVDRVRETASVADRPLSGMIRGVLKAYDLPGSGTALESRLASILRLADAFDQNMQAQPFNGEDIDEILARLRCGVKVGLWPEESLDALVRSMSASPIGEPESWQVPVVPKAALRVLNLIHDPCASMTALVDAASLDPAIDELVMRLANSTLFGSRTRISTLSAAIWRMGFATSQKIIATAALKPIFDSPKLLEVWRHSLQVADLAEQIAWRAGSIDPAEAYLAGLVHDVGRIALPSMSLYDSARLSGLVHGGCPQVYAENLLLRTDHTAIGAEIAAEWRLPATMVSAIRHHHRPEGAGSLLADLLYVAEHVSGSEEDLPSRIRLQESLNGIGLALADISDCMVSAVGNWLAAA